MFYKVQPPRGSDRAQVIADLRHRLATGADGLSLAAPAPLSCPPPIGPGRVLPVPEPLARALPQGGLPRGAVVGLLGDAGVPTLLLSLLAAADLGWMALVGMPEIGLTAAAEMGVDLSRLVVIPDPGHDVLQVVSVLVDGIDLIAVAAPPANLITPARLRVLTSRLRQRGAVLLVVGHWPGADLRLTARSVGWAGLGMGHGRLRDRELIVEVGGRRTGSGRTAALLLKSARSGAQGRVTTERLVDASAGTEPGAASHMQAADAG